MFLFILLWYTSCLIRGQGLQTVFERDTKEVAYHDEDFVYVSVADNGHGIPEELRERIFEPFFTTKEDGKGTGLGLGISRDIITRHHGKLLVESSVGVGTIFTVKLPRTAEIP